MRLAVRPFWASVPERAYCQAHGLWIKEYSVWILDFGSKYYQNQKIPKNKIDRWINYLTKALYKYQLRIAKDLLVII
jgi:hypothetical protein